MKKNIQLLLIFSILLFSFVLVGCKKEQSLDNFTFPADSPMNDANKNAVIIDTYLSIKDKPGDIGITTIHARRKDVFEVKGLQIINVGKNQQLWVHLSDGWVPRDSVQIYSSETKAKTAAKNLE